MDAWVAALAAVAILSVLALACALSPPWGSTSAGIVCTVRSPRSLATWAEHHRALGVSAFYVYVDECDSPDPAGRAECAAAGLGYVAYDAGFVEGETGMRPSRARDSPEALTWKQGAVVAHALRRARGEGLGWLFHVDADELLHLPGGGNGGGLEGLLASIPRLAGAIHFDNWELVPERPGMRDCLAEGTLFRADARRFLHYANGKAAVRVASDGARYVGPHRFHPGRWRRDVRISPERLVVLHYVSCSLADFTEKVRAMGQFKSFFGDEPYHVENMRALAACGGDEEGCAEEMGRRFAERARVHRGERLERVAPARRRDPNVFSLQNVTSMTAPGTHRRA